MSPPPCARHDHDLWFSTDPAGLEVAKRLCRPCGERDACRAAALERGEPWGVWGGEIFESGVIVARKRPRGRPSAAEAQRRLGPPGR